MRLVTSAITADREFKQAMLTLAEQMRAETPLPLSANGLSDGALEAFVVETLDELARACGLSRSEFCRCFKRIMNDTPMEYLNKTRIRKSLPLLLSRDYSVTQTAMLSGFSGSSYFSECFRKYMFCSPLEYIKNSKS